MSAAVITVQIIFVRDLKWCNVLENNTYIMRALQDRRYICESRSIVALLLSQVSGRYLCQLAVVLLPSCCRQGVSTDV
jgi:hypothetical protein